MSKSIFPSGGKRFLSSEEAMLVAKGIQDEAEEHGVTVALCGGFALQLYGSDRQTRDIDFIADVPLKRPSTGSLNIGGVVYAVKDVPVDFIIRKDDLQDLYEAALSKRIRGPKGLFVVAPDYLAVIKLLARRSKDQLDLLFMLRQKGLVNRTKAKAIISKHFGKAAFVVRDDFEAVILEADLMNARDSR